MTNDSNNTADPGEPPFELIAPSRLHFGLFSFGGQGAQYGGVGVMLDHPAVHLSFTSSAQFESSGSLHYRVDEFARRWSSFHDCALPDVAVEVIDCPPTHRGLGVGTQLGLATAAGLNRLAGRHDSSPASLARSVQRASRSAVGSYGFFQGGLIVEGGHERPGEFPPLWHRIALPRDWRFLLMCPRRLRGLFGKQEADAFRQAPAVDRDVRNSLVRQAQEALVPAGEAGDFARFSHELFEYGRRAGLCFASCQGGPFNGPQLARLVEVVRELGVPGVGQSSWGPTLFAVCDDQDRAQWLRQQLSHTDAGRDVDYQVARVNYSGAKLVYHGRTSEDESGGSVSINVGGRSVSEFSKTGG